MKDTFERRINDISKLAESYQKKSGIITSVRLAIFAFFIALWIYTLNELLIEAFLILVILFPFIFGVVVRYHRKLNYKKRFYSHLVNINEEEIRRIDLKPESYSNGTKYLDESHPYSADLDIFGPRSLYHLLNRCSTPSGEDALARWLSGPASEREIIHRQQAIKELKEDIDWRQEVQASEMEIDKKSSVNSFLQWLNSKSSKVSPPLLYGLPIIALIAIVLWIFGIVSFVIPLISVVINGYVTYKRSQETEELSKVTSEGLAILRKYRHIIDLIEQKEVHAEKLVQLKAFFRNDNFTASKSLKKFESLLEFVDARGNLFYHIFNAIFLIDLQLIYRSDRWRNNYKEFITQWFDAIGEMEALCSIAGFAFTNDGISYPEISKETHILESYELGHPLIKPSERIANNFTLKGKGALGVITGSNMSGKSTFLRTVCINAVLALAGAPVCAKSMKISIIDVFTSMRTQDDLEAHVSSFYAELKRIRHLLELLQKNKRPILFALDEVLKGTNSHDRHSGALALARQLNELDCFGMISTHDLELGQLAEERQNILNFSFNSDIVNDKILFDYKINEGVCRSFNASALMQQMGIDLKHYN